MVCDLTKQTKQDNQIAATIITLLLFIGTSPVNKDHHMLDQSTTAIGGFASQFLDSLDESLCHSSEAENSSIDARISASLASGISSITTDELVDELFAIADSYR